MSDGQQAGQPHDPVGVVLAGGAGRRMGGAKPGAVLAGHPLIHYPVAALSSVLGEVAIVAKEDTELPLMAGVCVWREPAQPRHPLAGIVEALRRAKGRPVVVLACDLPLVTGVQVAALVNASSGGAAVVAAQAGGRLQPLCARYEPRALGLLAGYDPNGRVVEQVARLEPATLDVEPGVLRNVNDRAGLAEVERLLREPDPDGRQPPQPNVNA